MAATALVLPPQQVSMVEPGGLCSLPWRAALQNNFNNLQAQINLIAGIQDGTISVGSAVLLDGEAGSYYLDWDNFTNTPTTLAGYGITDAQPLDATLTALAGLNSTAGLVEQTGADAFTKRAIGVAAATSIPTRADADARYDAIGSAAAAQAASQPLDATLTAFAGLTIAANSLTIGTGADAFSQTTFAASTFPARASSGSLEAKTITDGALSALAGGAGTAVFLRGDGTNTATLVFDGATATFTQQGYVGNSGACQFRGEKARGSVGTPAAVQNLDGLVSVQGRGYHSGNAMSGNVGDLILAATEGFTSGAQGTRWALRCVPNGSTTITNALLVTTTALTAGVDNTSTLGSASVRWSATYTVDQNLSGAEFQTGIQTPAQWVANTDNFTLTATTRILRASTDASRNLTGITGGASGRRLTIANVGAFDLVLVHDATSTAANRFLCPNNTNVTIRQNGFVEAFYDATSSRWRVMGV